MIKIKGTFPGEATLVIFTSTFLLGGQLKRKNLLPWEEILSLRNCLHFERDMSSKKANRKSCKLSPFVQRGKHGGVAIHQPYTERDLSSQVHFNIVYKLVRDSEV